MKLQSTLLLLFAVYALQGQVTISGTVRDEGTGETLIGATVFIEETGVGSSTNAYGFYSLETKEQDSITIVYSYVGYQSERRSIVGTKSQVIDVGLGGEGVDLEEVVVQSNSFREQLRSTQMSVENITTAEAKLLPAFFGEVDILKTIQLKPGIASGSEGRTGLFVRGGSPDQNLIVLDEAVVYNPNHLFGFFSTFNADAVKNVDIYKGGFPAEYGGRVSSVIDVKLRDGNDKKFSGSGGIGLITSRLTLEGPIIKDKSSFIVSGRRTYVDIFTRAVNSANEDNEDFNAIPDYYFYDLNAKVNYSLGERDRLFLSGYFGRDKFGFEDDQFTFGFDWGNATGTARWNHIFSQKLFSNTTFTFSDYDYEISNELTGFSFSLGSSVQDASLQSDFYYAMSNNHDIKFGASVIRHQFDVGRLKAGSDDGEVNFSAGDELTGLQFGAYISDEMNWGDRLKANLGLRFSGFHNQTTYLGLEPRAAFNYSLTDNLSLKASYARMMQYVHLVSTASLALPTDIWYPSSETVRPQISNQVAVGGALLLGNGYYLTNEYYYKLLDNQIEFANFAELFANDNLEEEFLFGEGYGYGMELGFEKKVGKLQGWLGYTLSYVRRREFASINGGREFFPAFDRRHDITAVAIYKFNEKYSLSATWVYGTGDRVWVPVSRIVHQGAPGADVEPFVTQYQEPRNDFRQPAYHRLDLGLVINFFPSWGESDLTISIYNVYDRRNPFFITLQPEFPDDFEDGTVGLDIPQGIKAEQVSLFPILPSVTWNFKF